MDDLLKAVARYNNAAQKAMKLQRALYKKLNAIYGYETVLLTHEYSDFIATAVENGSFSIELFKSELAQLKAEGLIKEQPHDH